MEPIVLEFSLTEAEYVESATLPVEPILRKTARNTLVNGVSFSLLAVIRPFGEFIFPALFALLCLYSGLTARRRTAKLYRKIYGEHPGASQSQKLTIDEQGIRCAWHAGDAVNFWVAFTHYVETPNLLVLYCGPWDNRAIPKRAFATPEQLARCIEVFRDRIGRTTPQPLRAFPVEVGSPAAVGDAAAPSP